MNPHLHTTPAMAVDLRTVGLEVEDWSSAAGAHGLASLWLSQCPGCVKRAQTHDSPQWLLNEGTGLTKLSLRHEQPAYGVPFEVACHRGCTYVEVIAALEELVRERLTRPVAVFADQMAPYRAEAA